MKRTIEIKQKEPQIIEEKPEVYTKENVCYWSSTWKKLVVDGGESAMGAKAKKFLKNDCIEYYKDDFNSDLNCFLCKPLKGYNKTTYKIKWNKEIHDLECNCQYYQTKLKLNQTPRCSHYIAVKLFLKILNSEKRKGGQNGSL